VLTRPRSGSRDIALKVSIIGTDRFTAGYGAAKQVHENVTLGGPVPAQIVRASQFHEFVEQLIDWGREGEVSRVTEMRTQLVAAAAAAEAVADLLLEEEGSAGAVIEVAGPREESMVAAAELLVSRRGDALRIEGVSDPDDPDADVWTGGALLPGNDARLVGPTFEDWLEHHVSSPVQL
jgi:hypothetical protein